MQAVAEQPAQTKRPSGHEATRKQIRGSSLLLAGRLASVGINFGAQVLIARFLSTPDFGAWAYALSVVGLAQGFATLGLDRATTRFVPIYHEKREYDKLFGTILLVLGSIFITGLIIITAFYAFPEQISRFTHQKEQPLALVYILIFLVPVDAIDGMFMGLFASFSNPRAIFFRRYVLAPVLKLSVVLLLILRKSGVAFLAYGYLTASVLGVLIYGWQLVRMFSQNGLWKRFRLAEVKVPAREVLAFTIPLMTSDLVWVLMNSSNAVILGYFHDINQVAFFRVVLPAAMMNSLVMNSFGLLFTPAAARLFAKGDHAGINELYWRTAVWLTVLSFPIFALTFAMARPLTILLYGMRYDQSSTVLALLSAGYYFNVALGFNGLTLKVIGKLRYVVIINLLAAAVNIAVNLVMIPRFGAVGAAIGTAGTMIVHNILKQAGLRLASGIRVFDWKYLSFYLTVALSAGVLLLVIRFLGAGSLNFALPLIALVSLFVFMASKKNLKVAETFPELAKLPLVRAILT